MVEIDRSRILAWQRCPRERYLAYHHLGKGLQRRAKALPLIVGSAFHEGAEELLKGDVETACYRAIKYLADAFKEKGVGFDGEDQTDASLVYSAQEQIALAEGLIRAWGFAQLPQFLETFEVIEVEKDGRAILHPVTRTWIERQLQQPGEAERSDGLVLLFRPDALVREKLSGDYYICSWKTTSMYGKRSLLQAKVDMQSMSEMFGVEQERGIKVEGILYLFVTKGKRQLDDYDQLWKQQSSLVYGWKRLKPADEFDDGWAWTFRYPKEDGSGHSTLGKGWQRKPIWSDYPGGVKAWIDDLHNRRVFPRHLDPFESVFPQSLPVERRADEVEHWKTQVVEQELEVAASVELVGRNPDPVELDKCFPQYTHSCHAYSGCAFLDICWNGVAAEPGELYTIRSANHPESSDEED